MAWIGNQVVLYKECELRVPDGNGGYTYQKFREDELHRPLILTSAQYPHLNISTSNLIGYYNNPQPRKGRLLSEIEVNIDYELFTGLTSQRTTPKFMCLTGSGDTQLMEIYGWIDRAEPIATKGPKTNTLIHWHVDYWFTLQMMEWNANKYPAQWSSKGFAFGRGTFKRGPAGMARPDPSAPRMWVKASETDLKKDIVNTTSGDSMKAPWAIMVYTETTDPDDTPGSGDEETIIQMAYWPVGEVTFTLANHTFYSVVPYHIYYGIVEEWFGLDPNAIIGIWFSPIPPYGTGGGATMGSFQRNGHTYGYFKTEMSRNLTQYITLTSTQTDDVSKYIVTDPTGATMGTLPWGLQFSVIRALVDVGTSGCYLNLLFCDGSTAIPEGEGRIVQVPLPSAPLTSNALSSYVYSGQESFDRDMAKLQQEQALKSGIAGLGSSAISGAVSGAVAGGPAGAAAGAAGGGILGGIGVAANYFIQGETNDKSMALTRELMANQTSNVIISSGGCAWFNTDMPHSWKLVKLVRDPLSKGELETEQAEKGCVCDTYTTNCTPTIRSGGGMRIEGLEVVGDLSKEARTYIQQMFARGVHLDLIY